MDVRELEEMYELARLSGSVQDKLLIKKEDICKCDCNWVSDMGTLFIKQMADL